jgi:hypothetical protein
MKRLVVAIVLALFVGFSLGVVAFTYGGAQAKADIVCPASGYNYTPKNIGLLFGRFLEQQFGPDGHPDDGEILHTAYDILECLHTDGAK